MSSSRQIILVASFSIAIVLTSALVYFGFSWNRTAQYLAWTLLAIFFLGMLVSNQEFEEDALASAERAASSALLSFAVLMELVYFPIADYVFGEMIRSRFFLADLLAFFLFLFFAVGTVIMAIILSRTARYSLFPSLTVFRSEQAFSALRLFFLPAVFLAVYLYILSPFLIVTS